MVQFYVENFGCRATQADGAAIEQQFRASGLERAESASEAAVVVLNTCTVTSSADQDARAAIRRIHRENPNCKIVVTGCYAQRAPGEIAALPGVSQVIGNSDKHRLAEIALSPSCLRAPVDRGTRRGGENSFVSLSTLMPLPPTVYDERPTADGEGRIFVSDIFAHTNMMAAPVFDGANERTRPNLKVQDGCDNRCSFCVIPYVRGQSRSLPLAEVLRQVKQLVDGGYREVVISGINLGRWGNDLAVGLHFEDLIRAILHETPLEKLRISSVEPMDWSDELIRLMAGSPRIAKHAHVPLQSGSDSVLRRMHRKYRPWHYREKVESIRAAMPQAAIGADVMVGFPGETNSEFEETLQMIERLPLTYLHVFTYSPRPGTPAAVMRDQVPVRLARDRNRILRNLASEKNLDFRKSFIGEMVDAITLNVQKGEFTEALTDNYLKLRLSGHHEPNQWLNARITAAEQDALVGSV